MKVYGSDLRPWPHLDAPSYYPDTNALFDPARGMAIYAAHLEGLTFVGGPDYATREIRAHMQELGAGVIMGLFQFGSLPHALAAKNIELFAKTVLPALRCD